MGSVICSIARTPLGKFNGALAPLTAMDLGGVAIAGALQRAGLMPTRVDEVLFGHVIGAGQGQITARQAAVDRRVVSEMDQRDARGRTRAGGGSPNTFG